MNFMYSCLIWLFNNSPSMEWKSYPNATKNLFISQSR